MYTSLDYFKKKRNAVCFLFFLYTYFSCLLFCCLFIFVFFFILLFSLSFLSFCNFFFRYITPVNVIKRFWCTDFSRWFLRTCIRAPMFLFFFFFPVFFFSFFLKISVDVFVENYSRTIFKSLIWMDRFLFYFHLRLVSAYVNICCCQTQKWKTFFCTFHIWSQFKRYHRYFVFSLFFLK